MPMESRNSASGKRLNPRPCFLWVVVALLVASAACTGCSSSTSQSSPPPPQQPPPPPPPNTIVQSFDGDSGTLTLGLPTYKDHPDMGIASNGTYVVAVTGQTVNIYNTSGALQSSTAGGTFISNAGVAFGIKANDPRIVYDPFISRWLYVCSCANDYLIVSSGSNPVTSSWKGVALSGRNGDLLMHVGFDKNWVYVSEYDVCSGVNSAAEFAIPSADVAWSGGGSVSLAHEVSDGCHTFDAIPELDLNPAKNAASPGYFLSRSGEIQNQANAAMVLAIDTFTPSSSTAGTFSSASSPATISTGYLYNTPVDVSQPGSPGGVRGTESHRPFSLMTINGTDLQLVWSSGPCQSSCGSQGSDSQQLFFWFDISIPGLSVLQQAKLSDRSLGYLFPSLAVDGSNNTLITATACSTTLYCSVVIFYHLTSDGSGVFHGPNLVTSGSANYQVCTTTPHPGWGTYTTTAQDPADTTKLWTFQEYAASATPCRWQTRILELQL